MRFYLFTLYFFSSILFGNDDEALRRVLSNFSNREVFELSVNGSLGKIYTDGARELNDKTINKYKLIVDNGGDIKFSQKGLWRTFQNNVPIIPTTLRF